MPTKCGKGSVGEGVYTGKKSKATPHAGGKSVSEKSQAARTRNYTVENHAVSTHT